MNQGHHSDLAAFVLRIGLGVMYLAHSVVLKLMTFGLVGTAGFFVSVGLPGWLAYVTFAAEAIGGVLLILGIQSRWVALALMPALLGAIIWVHAANGWVFTATNGGWEYPAFLLIASVVQVLLGDGAYALSARRRSPAQLQRQFDIKGVRGHDETEADQPSPVSLRPARGNLTDRESRPIRAH